MALPVSRGIDYALANIETSPKFIEQPPMLLKKMHYKKSVVMN